MTNPQESTTLQFISRKERVLVFFLVCLGVLSLTYGILFVIDFLPQPPKPETETFSSRATDTLESETVESMPLVVGTIDTDDVPVSTAVHEREAPSPDRASDADMSEAPLMHGSEMYPLQITFDSLDGRRVEVLNPTSRDVATLDAALLEGAVRHPDSADFERVGTIVLFGHSSYLPSVRNKNFQAFNGIQKLAWGDLVRLESGTHEYVYRVDRVYEVSADDAELKIEAGKPKLTLVTCDSFGAKSDRFVVEATLIEDVPLTS
jgi:LPXTG-site transpeptidase (sortase) family protein